MMLSKRQRKGFVRLLRSLCLYVADEVGIRAPNEGDADYRESYRLFEAVKEIWGTEDGRVWIDRFMKRNPSHFNKRDLAIVASWKNAVANTFCITRVGDDSALLTEDYAFIVRGIDDELHEVVDLPDLSWTALLPFDGTVTFAWGLAEPSEHDPAMLKLPKRGLGWYRDRGHLVRNEKQFLRLAPDIPSVPLLDHDTDVIDEVPTEDLGVEAMEPMDATEVVEGDPYEVAPGQHRGALAGIWGEERKRLGVANLQVRMGQAMSSPLNVGDQIAEECEPTLPIASLKDVFMTMRRDEIAAWAKWLRLRRYSHLHKDELAYWTAHFFVENSFYTLSLLRQQGKQCVEGARRTFEAGGRLDVRFQDIETLEDFPQLCPPVLNGYRMGDILVAHMPDEVVKVLGDVDWDAEMARVETIERAEHYLEALVSYRGIVDVEEVDALLKSEPDLAGMAPCDITTMSRHMNRSDLIACTFVALKGDDSYGEYAMDPLLMHEAGLDVEHTEDEPLEVYGSFLPEEILSAQRGILPRSVSGMKPGDDALGLFLSPDTNPLAKEIVAYLDERVPDGEDDYTFAGRVLEGVVLEGWQHDFSAARLREVLDREGFNGTPAQIKHLEGLFRRMFDQMPRWHNNGWSNAEVDAHRI